MALSSPFSLASFRAVARAHENASFVSSRCQIAPLHRCQAPLVWQNRRSPRCARVNASATEFFGDKPVVVGEVGGCRVGCWAPGLGAVCPDLEYLVVEGAHADTEAVRFRRAAFLIGELRQGGEFGDISREFCGLGCCHVRIGGGFRVGAVLPGQELGGGQIINVQPPLLQHAPDEEQPVGAGAVVVPAVIDESRVARLAGVDDEGCVVGAGAGVRICIGASDVVLGVLGDVPDEDFRLSGLERFDDLELLAEFPGPLTEVENLTGLRVGELRFDGVAGVAFRGLRAAEQPSVGPGQAPDIAVGTFDDAGGGRACRVSRVPGQVEQAAGVGAGLVMRQPQRRGQGFYAFLPRCVRHVLIGVVSSPPRPRETQHDAELRAGRGAGK